MISALSPFKHRTFTVLWAAALISNIGSWMHAVGAAWLMTSLSSSPLAISLVQTAATLPIFLFALPAGTLADIFNRRTLLIISNVMMLLVAAVFTLIVWFGYASVGLLFLFTFLLGTGAAFMAPAWQAIIPDMVPKNELSQAVALGGISINLSRAIGPALAGLLIAVYGMSSPFIVNTITFIAIIIALLWWRPPTLVRNNGLPPEKIWTALKIGIRYASHSKPLKATMLHVFGFMFFANAFWGLLPIIAKTSLNTSAAFFGLLMGSVGIGAVLAALLLPKIKSLYNGNQMVAIGTLGTASVTAYFAFAESQLLALVASLIYGVSWILVLSTVNVSAQQALPDWVRARGLAIFITVFFGGISLGAAFWGWVAGATSLKTSMLVSAFGAVIYIIIVYRFKLLQGAQLDFSPSHHWPVPFLHQNIQNDQGPVMITIRYKIGSSDRESFIQAIYALKISRYRNGAYRWGLFEDTEQEGGFIEYFMEESWVAHLRHHERVSHEDEPLQKRVNDFHQGRELPIVSHFLAAHLIESKL